MDAMMMAIMMAVGLMGLMMMEKEPDWDGRTFSTLTESLSLFKIYSPLVLSVDENKQDVSKFIPYHSPPPLPPQDCLP